MTESNEQIEEKLKFRQKSNSNSLAMFESKGSAGNNSTKLAGICTAWDLVVDVMNWHNKPLGKVTQFLTQYQASVDTKYHNDFKDVLIAEEIERRRAERKGISILSK